MKLALLCVLIIIAVVIITAAWCFIDDLAAATARTINRRLRPLPELPKHAGSPRRVYERTKPPTGDKAQREAMYGELREIPEPGRDIYTDHSVVLPYTRQLWQPPAPETSPAGPVSGEVPVLRTERQLDGPPHRDAGRTWVKDRPGTPPGAERLATDTDVRRAVTCAAPARPAGMLPDDVADVLPDYVIKALGGHDGVDACVESIVARTVNL